MSTSPEPLLARDPYHVPHRKNAAEWAMWVALLPLVPLAHLLERSRRRNRSRGRPRGRRAGKERGDG